MTRIAFPFFLLALGALSAGARAGDDDPVSQTVTVTGKKALVTRKIDKTVHDVSNLARAANGSAQDVLQSTPEVSVTADGQIAVKGNTQVTVLVDGKPSAMMAGSNEERALALQTMSGADVASVEVITNPSAAYNANGGAILNIVLKRNRKPGAHGQLRASASDQGLWNAGASGDLTRQGLSVHGELALRHDGTLKMRSSAVDWKDPPSANSAGGGSGQSLQSSKVFVHRVVDSAALGIDDVLGDHDTASLSLRHNARRSRPVLDTLNVVRSGADDSVYHRISAGPNQQSDDSASLAYTHQDAASVVKTVLQHSATEALVDKSYQDVFVAPQGPMGYSHGATRSTRRIDQATLDWTRSVEHGAQRSQWGMGLDLQDQLDAIDNYQATLDPASHAETPDPATTNAYAVATTLGAAYLTGQFTHGRWETLLGARAEHMALRVRPGQGPARDGHWQALNPSLHLKYAAADDADLTLGYRRSLQRPDPRQLDPFTTYVDAQNLSRGNPGLQPQRLSTWELGANAGAAPLSAGAGLFYRSSRDTVLDARSFADGVLVTSKQNGGQARSLGITGSLDWRVNPRLKLGADGGVYAVRMVSPDLFGTVRQRGNSGYVNLRAGYRAGADDLSLDAHGQSAGITPLGRFGPTSSVNVTWKRQLSKTLSLTVNANDLFDGSRRGYRTDSATFRQVGVEHFVARRIYVGFVEKLD